MAATNLTFSLNASNRYEATYLSQGPVTIQMKREKSGFIFIYANLDGIGKTYVGGYNDYNGSENAIFTIDFPAGVNVTIETKVAVESAKMLSD